VLPPQVLRQGGVEVFPGMTLFPALLPHGKSVSGTFETPRETLEFGYMLRGRARAESRDQSKRYCIDMPQDTVILRRPPGLPGVFHGSSDDDLALIGLEFTPESAERHLWPWRPGAQPEPVVTASLSAQERYLAWQLLESDTTLSFGPLLRQGLVLQLLSVTLGRLHGVDRCERANIAPFERRKVNAARDLLDQCLETPADLADMAREVGLPPARLKAGFVALHGMTPFRYLHEQRMQHARLLIEQEDCSVSEAAWRIGYTNVSHFGAAFKRRFGDLPAICAKAALHWERRGHETVLRRSGIQCGLPARKEGPQWQVISAELRPGMLCVASRLDAAKSGSFDFEIENPPVHFGGILHGSNRCSYSSGQLKGHEVVRTGGDNGIVCLPKTTGRVECAPGEDACVVTVLVSPGVLHHYLDDAKEQTPQPLRRVLRPYPEQLLWRGRRNARKTYLLGALLETLRHRPAWRLMQESMALELVALQLEECREEQRHPPTPPRISKGDEERLREAKRLLLLDLEHPPRISQLARLAGLSEKKLKAGFPVLFGDTVYGCFRAHRLNHARRLIEEDRLSVSEVAYSIGYLNLSHFSQAFRVRFGMNPSELLRRRSEKLP
jgi:AraC-like DNA-binding protein